MQRPAQRKMKIEVPLSVKRILETYTAISTPSGYQVFSYICEDDVPHTGGEIKDRFGMSGTTLYTYLREFERLGLVGRESEKNLATYRRTDFGYTIMQNVQRLAESVKDRMVSERLQDMQGLSEKEKQDLEELIRKGL